MIITRVMLFTAVAYTAIGLGWYMRDLQEENKALHALAKQRHMIVEKTRSKGEVINGHVTAYLCVDPMERRYHGITKSGARCVPGRTAAVDPRRIPIGSVVYVPALDRYYIAEDTGNMIKGNAIDLAFKNREDAVKWGRRNLDVVILKQSS